MKIGEGQESPGGLDTAWPLRQLGSSSRTASLRDPIRAEEGWKVTRDGDTSSEGAGVARFRRHAVESSSPP